MKAIDKCSSFHNTHGAFNLIEPSISLVVFITVLVDTDLVLYLPFDEVET